MKRLTKTMAAALLCAALLCGLILPAGASSDVYLMAVNDTVVDMTADNMPVVVGGVLHVPYTMLSSRVSGINLGVSAQYSTTRQTVLVSSGRKGVTFDTRANNAYDLQGNILDTRAVVRNAMVYLPLPWVCSYFGSITYTTTRTKYGTLVRVTNNAVILSDAEFVDAADSLLKDNLRRYEESLGGNAPSGPDGPAPSDRPETGPIVYLAFDWGEQAEAVARLLENSAQRGLFFFTPEQLARQDDLVRRLTGMGHTVGLALEGSDPEQCLLQAEQGRQLLSDIARCAGVIIKADGLEEQGLAQLSDAGYAVWSAGIRGEETASANALLRRLSGAQPNYVGLAADEAGLSLLTGVLPVLTGSGYRLRQAVAPAL